MIVNGHLRDGRRTKLKKQPGATKALAFHDV